ncbi:armadillo repeat-containing protein 1-like [Schistocerca gregaria]|uniref:armadillo repeat-containing protein 1-like n=1 Tax=Schistocerca gregaria TaxID=7010 RepID=UPI00211F2398|nr:armadillo repeat-containing protein 1-like [Schistocerca gregaria]
MTSKEIVTKLRHMAADPLNRAYLLDEPETLPSLLVFLDDPDPEIVLMALEVIYFLSLLVEGRSKMAQNSTLLAKLRHFMMAGSLKQKKVSIVSYTNLQAYTLNTDHTNASTSEEQPKGSEPSVSYAIYVENLNEANRLEIEQLLLSIKGIVSICCVLQEHKIILHAAVPAQTVIEKLAESGRKASLDKQDLDLQSEDGYLAEVDQDSSKKEDGESNGWFGIRGLISLVSESTEEKKARLERERKQKSGWFGKIGKALYIM